MPVTERIYTRAAGGALEPMEEAPFATEDALQALIADHPELLDGKQMRPGDPRRWILVTREKGIAESVDSGSRWALDHLLVDQDAVPTLVEVKRGRNPEIRRAVVGQMLEYAAHAAQSWSATDLRRAFEESTSTRELDPDDELARLLQEDEPPDADGFWQRVVTNLAANRLRLLFVADDIPDPLKRVVEFLNLQMPALEVLAVEIKQFHGTSTQTLVPRVIGRIEKQSSGLDERRRTPPISRESLLAALPSDQVRSAAARILGVAEKTGGSLVWRGGSVTIKIPCSGSSQPVSVGWIFVPGASWRYMREFTFGSLLSERWPSLGTLRDLLVRWADQFSADDFTEAIGRTWVVGYDAAAEHIGLLEDRLATVLSELKEL